jgi:hypothetical protein
MLLEILRIFGMLLSAFAVAVLAATLALTLGVVVYVLWNGGQLKPTQPGRNSS